MDTEWTNKRPATDAGNAIQHVATLTLKGDDMGLTNQELCYKCAVDGGTLCNMRELIIPLMNTRNDDLKYVIYHLSKGIVHPDWPSITKECKAEIVANVKAIRAFYQRFPEYKRTWSRR